MMAELPHLNTRAEAHMVDVGDKPASPRVAIAEGRLQMAPATVDALLRGDLEKGDALATARVAGIMAAKRTADVVPLCHPVALTHVTVTLIPQAASGAVHCEARAETRERTGVEMEALNAVQAALLTLYDMAKALERGMTIEGVCLVYKAGGRSGEWRRG